MSYREKYFAPGWQSLNSEYVRQNINYIGINGFFRQLWQLIQIVVMHLPWM